ncbi:MAG: D-alanyl-D-alanine carboxypeptidase/D-alanyl-D-alanine-endopeptidase [Planctomycetes bacterium]|nr:D-alanyl-D-alanine carboxypeptidase/D-alanyl-D-alanine-endopeptidase [Planctomycetota bacterium]
MVVMKASCIVWLLAASLSAADLKSSVDKLLGTVPSGGKAAVVVFDLDRQKLLYSAHGGVPMSPASLVKLTVSACALHQFGSTYTMSTTLVAMGGSPRDGVCPQLGVIAGGDPCLDEHFYDQDPDRAFVEWAQALKARGITRIAGDIVIDGSRFSGPIRPDTYPQDPENQQRWYSAPASAFAWNDNCIEVRVVPTRAGEPCTVQLRPRSSRVVVRNLTKTVATRGDSNITVSRDPNANTVTVSGSYSRASDWFEVAIHSDPDLLTGDHLRSILVGAGIAVGGKVRLGAVPADAPVLVATSHDLLPALTILNVRSQNFYGEMLLRQLGVARVGEGSISAGCTAVDTVLRELVGPDVSGYTVLDGCGLSYDNVACADFFARLLWSIHTSPMAAEYVSTLKREDSGAVKGYVKTGSLAIASNLAGYLDRPRKGGRVCFAILLNRGTARGFAWGSTLRERLFQALCRGIE